MIKNVLLILLALPFNWCQAQQIPYLTSNHTVFAIGEVNEACHIAELEQQGVLINSVIGTIFTAQVPFSLLNAINNDKGLVHLSLSNLKNSTSAQNFSALKHSNADKANNGTSHNLATDYSGKGVVVGIVDIGFQTDNPTFYDSKGEKLRISRYWDQYGTGTPPSGFNYGKECADSQSIVNQLDFSSNHGTHVAGIAAGSGYSSKNLIHKGVAHDAELVFVKLKYSNDSVPESALGDAVVANPTIIDAYKYIFDYANSISKPAVLNLSWGSHTGPHDGTSIFDRAVEQLVAKPGNIIIGANGNSGRTEMHLKHDFNNWDTLKTIAYDRSRGWRNEESVYVDIWGSANTPFQFRAHLYDTSKNKLASTRLYTTDTDQSTTTFINNGTDTLEYTIEIEKSYTHNSKPNILFYSNHPNPKKHFVVLELIAEKGRIDAWNSGDALRWSSGGFTHNIGSANFESDGFIKGDVTHTMGENGGTGKGTISVGAYINKDIWINFDGRLTDNSNDIDALDIAGFSSEGPTVDGRVKPDISAPGQGIISAINRHVYNPNGNRNSLMDSTNFNGTPNYWVMQSGTSMAAPHVCGIVALMLEANPRLSTDQVRDILINTAFTDGFTGTVPNNKWGHGKVDALAAVKAAENQLAIEELEKDQTLIYPNPASNLLNIKSELIYSSYIILNTEGQEIAKGEVLNQQINLSKLGNGFYLIQLMGEKSQVIKRVSVVK